MSARRLEFFFDVGSPWTYLAFSQIEALCTEMGSELVWKPILVGGIFNQVNEDVYQARAKPNPRKLRYHAKDLQDWARLYDLEIRWPTVFPVNSVKAMRAVLVAAEAGRLPAFARACFEAYWGRDQDLSEDPVIAAVAEQAGLDPTAVLAGIARADIKTRLRDQTQELIDRGGFGSPTIFVGDGDMYFGNDRLPLVREALRRG